MNNELQNRSGMLTTPEIESFINGSAAFIGARYEL
jgi:hypothetical protein